MTLKK
jgi:hypothetical protein